MSKLKNEELRVRMNLELTKKEKEILIRAKELSDAASFTEAIRRALKILVHIETLQQNGGRIKYEGKDGKEEILVFI